MSFSIETNKVQYDGNDSTKAFPVTFPFQSNDDITVILTDTSGVDTTLVEDTDYTLTGSTVSYPYPLTGFALATGEILTIVRIMTITQETDLSNHGAYFLEALEDALDKDVMTLQQLKEITDRCVKLDITDSDTPPSVTDFNTALATVQALESAFENLVVQSHSAVATGGQTVFTMPVAWPDLDATSNVTVYDDGLKIDRDDYAVTDTAEITFDTGRTVGHTIIFELHEALSSDDLDAALASIVVPWNVVIGSDPSIADYPTFAAYAADSPAAGDVVLRTVSETLTSTLTIPNGVEVITPKDIFFNVATAFSPIIDFGDEVKTTGKFYVKCSHSGTIAIGMQLDCFHNHHQDLVIECTSGTITDAFKVDSTFKYARCRATHTGGGAITNLLNDISTSITNDIIVIGTTGGIQRSLGARTFNQLHLKKGADVASAGALVLGNDGNYFDITGTTNITSIGSLSGNAGSVVTLHFDGILTLTHHATDLVLPNGENIITAVGDEFTFIEYFTGDWRLVGSNLTGARVKVGTFSKDISEASATQAVTGVGFKPRAVIFFGGEHSTSGKMSWGLDTGPSGSGICVYDNQGVTGDEFGFDSSFSIYMLPSAGNYTTGDILTLDADGFTINWTKTGAPAGTAVIGYLAIR